MGTIAVTRSRSLRLLGAPTNLGLAPYPDGSPRAVNRAPAALRQLGLVSRLAADDRGDIVAQPYCDPGRGALPIRNVSGLADHTRRLAAAVTRSLDADSQLLVLGGDCSVLLGSMLGLRERGRFGLVFVDGHCDFATPELSSTGGAAGMDLALATGAFDHPLAQLHPGGPLVNLCDVALVARKDLADEPQYGAASIRHTEALDIPLIDLCAQGLRAALDQAMARVARPELDGFWVHFDVDVLDPGIMPAVDSPEPDGLSLEEAGDLLRGLLSHPRACGMELTIYDPGLDPDGACGRRLVDLLEAVFS